MPIWLDYVEDKAPDAHTVTGQLRILPDVYSPQLDNARDILVYLPPSYLDSGRRYPVIYMHDGYNLFDAATSFGGQEWHVDETMQQLATEGQEAIVVGIANTSDRLAEYTPFNDWRKMPVKGDRYLDFLVETVKPMIDTDFRTLPDRAHTGIAGSSLGGLISLYGFFRAPHVFGFAGIFSPALWVASRSMPAYIETIQYPPPGRLYLDIGLKETRGRYSKAMVDGIRGLRDLLERKGYRRGESLLYVEDEHGAHTEADWARRLPDALRFLLRGV